MAPLYLTPLQLAGRYLIVSRSTVYAALREGTLPGYRIKARTGCRGKWAVREDEFLAWLEGHRAAPAAAAVPTAPAGPAGRGPFAELDPDRLRRAWADR